jgi:S1-C subfamily serine protease
MNWVDAVLVLLCISAVYRGRDIGLVQQVFSTIGFFGGLFLGAILQSYTVTLAHTQLSRTLITLLTTLGTAFIFLIIGEFVGALIKHRIQKWRVDRVDRGLGSIVGVITLLATAWLSASIISTLPFPGLQASIRDSVIISALTRELPPAPDIVAGIGRLVDPNGFPKVFTGNEPTPKNSTPPPNLGDFNAAVAKDQPSVVKIEGLGCGGVVEGSGFIAAGDTVVTNAHVVAGVKRPYIVDSSGQHPARAIWFNPDLDLAVLKANDLAGSPLAITTEHIERGSGGAVLGYPGGGSFTAGAAVVLDEFTAVGRNIYNTSTTQRDVYELSAHVIPGNSGGPVIDRDGTVIGVVFAESTTYNNVGYALTTPQVVSELRQAEAQSRTVATGNCAE